MEEPLEEEKNESLPFSMLLYKALATHFSILRIFSGVPMSWDNVTKKFTVSRSNQWKFNACFAYLSVIIVLYNARCIPAIVNSDVEELDSVGFGVALTCVMHFCYVFCTTVLVQDPKRIIAVVNAIFDYSRYYNGK
jgi:hypothetical protein